MGQFLASGTACENQGQNPHLRMTLTYCGNDIEEPESPEKCTIFQTGASLDRVSEVV